ncbi:GNAT family N-acetyltransferase [Plantibacter sp. RU18]|uniref:GNAT family N-acetyltransferase n=1 Tax=Plantibacter sp. RU18 TaxID=3158143 RepID=UPI003D361CBA
MAIDLLVTAHQDLSGADLDRLRELFDDEYLHDFGDWNPERPYGYAPADFHVTATRAGKLLGHVGFQMRTIGVGDRDVRVAGVGGVLVSDAARGSGLGSHLMHRAQKSMRGDAAVSFGYLGCRPEVVPFYESVGWTLVHARERHTARLNPAEIIESDSAPILICSAVQPVHAWPEGDVDLRGGAW